MLDWIRIDNEKTFQRLVNHVVAAECNSAGFIPSSPYIGADGGWDGLLEGYYPPEQQHGLWSIQSKWTEKSFNKALNSLRAGIRDELRKAEANSVDHLRIATNAELRADQVKALEDLNTSQVATLRVWYREELSRRIERQPWVRHEFFGDPQYPAFVPWGRYFDAVEKHLLPDSGTSVEGFRVRLARAEDFVRASQSSVLLIHGPAGHGKSHLLRELARTANQVDGQRQAWLVRTGHRLLRDALQDELVEGRRYLLLLDDAERFPDDVETLVSFSKHQGESVKVVLVSTAAGIQGTRDILQELGCMQLVEELPVEKWSRDDLVQLLRISSGQEVVQDEEAIAAAFANPFLIVWAGKRIGGDSSLDVEGLRSTFVNQMRYDARTCLSGILLAVDVRDFMVNLASIAPLGTTGDRARVELAARFKLDDQSLARALSRLERGGLLTQAGGIARFDPQVRGELYLAFELDAAGNSKEVDGLIQAWLRVCEEALLSNLCAAARYVRLPHLRPALSRIVQDWTSSAQQTPRGKRTARLGALVNLSWLIPEDCVDLVLAYLDEDGRLRRGLDNGARPSEAPLPGPDDFGPALSELIGIPSIRSEVVSSIDKLAHLPGTTMYYNDSPEFLIRRCVSPIYNPPALVDSTLDTLASWLGSLGGVRIKLLSAAVSEVLAAAHEYSKSCGDRVELGAKVLKKSPDIIETRDKALAILEAMLMHSSREVKIAGIDVAANLGQASMARLSDVELSLSGRIAEERRRLVAVIGGLVGAGIEFELLNAIENLFLDWWAMERPGTEGVFKHLMGFPRTPEYLVCRHYVSPGRAVMDFRSLAAEAPVAGRWTWFVDNVQMRPSRWRREDFRDLVGALAGEFRSEREVVDLLNSIERRISVYSVWAQPRIVDCWVGESPDLFTRIRSDATLWPRVPDRFKREIDVALGSTDPDALLAQAEEVLASFPDISSSSLDALLIAVQLSNADRAVVQAWMRDLVARATPDQCCLLLFRVPHIFPGSENAGRLAELVTIALSHHDYLLATCNVSTWMAVRRVLEQRDSLDQDRLDKLRTAVLEAVKETPKLDFHARDLLKFALCGVDSAIEFVGHRMEKAARLSEGSGIDEPFEAFPHMESVDAIPLQVSSLHDFAVMMDLLVTWSNRLGVRRALGIEALIEATASLRDQDTGRLYVQDFAEACLESGDINKALEAARFMPLQPDTVEFVVVVAGKAIELGEAWRAEALLRHHMRCPGPLTYWAPGPSDWEGLLTNTRDLFRTMYTGVAGGQLRSIIKRCIDQLDAELESVPHE
jgi:hypothetical protein